MKRHYLLTVILFFSVLQCFPQTSWEKLFSKRSTDVFRSVQEVSASTGYIAAGYTADSTAHDTDAYVVRFQNNGDTLWTFTYNGTNSKKDIFYKIIKTTDGGYIACGYTSSASGASDDFLVVKLTSTGNISWDMRYGGSEVERAQDIIETSDGYTIAGYTATAPAQYYDATAIHFDFTGAILWEKIYGGSGYEEANTIKQLPDGGYIIGGQSSTGGNPNQYLVRIDQNGNSAWSKVVTTSTSSNIESILVLADGFIFVGSNNTGGGDNGYLVKTDTFGIVQWSKTFGGANQDDFHRIEPTSDGGYILSGTTQSSGAGESDMWLFKTNNVGDSTWARKFGGANHDHGYSAVETTDGGYIIVGYTSSFGFRAEDAYAVKVGSDGTGTNHLAYVTAYALVSPTCSGTSSTVRIVLRNFGNEPVSAIPITMEVTGGVTQTLNSTLPGPFAPSDAVTISFSPTINTAGAGAITFHGFTGTPNDVYPQNNSFTTTVSLLPCVGIEDIERPLGYSLYPNPAGENIYIDFNENYHSAKIEMMNAMGELVRSYELSNTGGMKEAMDIASIAHGIYFVRVSTEEGFDVRKLIIE